MVTPMPPGSRPGMTSFATAPTSNPMIIIHMNVNIIFSFLLTPYSFFSSPSITLEAYSSAGN
jgi:hypothetical protein